MISLKVRRAASSGFSNDSDMPLIFRNKAVIGQTGTLGYAEPRTEASKLETTPQFSQVD